MFPTATDAAYFRTFEMPLLVGRNFTPADVNSGVSLAIVDTLAAKNLFGTEDAVGREFSFNSAHSNRFGLLFRVIGVVPTVRRADLGAAPAMGNVYIDADQVVGKYSTWSWGFRSWYLAVRSPLSTATVISEVKTAARKVIPGVPLYDVQTMNQRLSGSLASSRLLTVLVLLFAIGALVLAAIGLYAVQAYAVAQRAREFAIRAALGANRSRLLAMVLGETARLLVIGLVVGLAGLAGIGIAFASAFYGIGAVDPASMVIVAVVLALAALAASWFPAWRASRVAPDKALRNT
jgi:ABC-type antimicrobial peptide transport system permease subunit